MDNMEIKLYDNEYLNGVFNIVHKTIEEIYVTIEFGNGAFI
jgi:hypothetical protein